MAKAGRPRLTPEEYKSRLDAYCDRYGVSPTAAGIPPFPTGQRETKQHREWIKLYKAHNRISRRQRSQCERCGSPSDGSVFCETHRASNSARTGGHGATADERRELLAAQRDRCPICEQHVEIWDAVDHCHLTGRLRGLVHPRCNQLLAFAEALGRDAVHNATLYLWPERATGRRRR
jgi:hypothetical protein